MNKNINRRHVLQAGLAAMALPAWQLAAAEDKFPSRPVKIIVPLPPGGVVDNTVRALVNTMQPTFAQPLVIDNKPGGAFVIGMNTLASAPADGYTLIHVNAAFLSAQAVFKRFDVFKQLVPIAGLGETDSTISVPGKSNFKTIKDLIEFGKANPGKLSYASPGPGNLEHLALANFCKAHGIEAVHVPFKGGPEVVKAMISGEVDFGTLAVPLVQQFSPDGRVRPLVLLNEKRNAALPDVPTYREARLDISRLTLWGGLCAPAGTPPAIVAQLEKSVLEAARNPELQKQFIAAGLLPAAQTSAEFGKIMRDDYVWISKATLDAKLNLN
jgi:tripartite-type tricarboxylate transporter receptor subunit TctC